MWAGVIHLGDEVRFGLWLALVLRCGTWSGRDVGGFQPWHAPDRGPVQPLRRPSRPCLRRWPTTDRAALLHKLPESALRAGQQGIGITGKAERACSTSGSSRRRGVMPVLWVECKAPRSLGKHAYHRFQGLLLEPVR